VLDEPDGASSDGQSGDGLAFISKLTSCGSLEVGAVVGVREENSLARAGLLTGLTKTVLETALEAEISEHLGSDKHDPSGRNRANSRNGTRTKTARNLTKCGAPWRAASRTNSSSSTAVTGGICPVRRRRYRSNEVLREKKAFQLLGRQ